MIFNQKNKFLKHIHSKPQELSFFNRKRNSIYGSAFTTGSIFILVVFTLIPFIFIIKDAFNANGNKISAPFVLSIQNFNDLFNDPFFIDSISNSFLYMVMTVPLSLVVSLLISWAISTLHRKYAKGFWQSIFFLPHVTSAVAISLSFAYIFNSENGILNAILGTKIKWLTDPTGHYEIFAFVIYGVWRNIAFEVLILSTAMMSLNKKLYQVSEIDGAGPTRQFFNITIPQMWPVIFYIITLGIIQSIKVFPLALFNNNSDSPITNLHSGTLLLYIFNLIAGPSGQYSKAAAASIILGLISFGIVFIFRIMPSIVRKIIKKRNEKLNRLIESGIY